MNRPNLNRVMGVMPNPNNRFAFLTECRTLMRASLLKFATMQRRIDALFEYYLTEAHGDQRVASQQFNRDIDCGDLVGDRNSAAASAQTYALAILAEESVERMIPAPPRQRGREEER